MTDPTEITIKPGEPKQVIEDVDVGSVPYIVEVSDAPVRFAHKKRQAARGATLSAGQTHTLSNFRGSGIWLAAPDTAASVRVRPAGASLESQPPKDVTIVEGDVQIQEDLDIADRAGREIGKARLQESGGTLIDPATDDTLGSELPRRIETWNAGTLPVDVNEVDITGWTVPTAIAVEQNEGSPISESTTADGEANAASLELGRRTSVDVAYRLTGPAEVVVEVSTDGVDWFERQRIDTDGEGTTLLTVAFEHIRAFATAETETITIAAKGV